MKSTIFNRIFGSALLFFTALGLIAAGYPDDEAAGSKNCQMQIKYQPTLEYKCVGSDCSILRECPLGADGDSPHTDTTTVPGSTLHYCNCDGGTIWCAGVGADVPCQVYVEENDTTHTKTTKCMDCGCSLGVNPPDAGPCVDKSIPSGSWGVPCKCTPPAPVGTGGN